MLKLNAPRPPVHHYGLGLTASPVDNPSESNQAARIDDLQQGSCVVRVVVCDLRRRRRENQQRESSPWLLLLCRSHEKQLKHPDASTWVSFEFSVFHPP